MTSESSEPQEDDQEVLRWHLEMERLAEFWDESPTYEKWRRGQKWN